LVFSWRKMTILCLAFLIRRFSKQAITSEKFNRVENLISKLLIDLVYLVKEIYYKGYKFIELHPGKIFITKIGDLILRTQTLMIIFGDPIIENDRVLISTIISTIKIGQYEVRLFNINCYSY
jgi:hypothetical protein